MFTMKAFGPRKACRSGTSTESIIVARTIEVRSLIAEMFFYHIEMIPGLENLVRVNRIAFHLSEMVPLDEQSIDEISFVSIS